MSENRSGRYGWLLGLSALLGACDTFGDPAQNDPFGDRFSSPRLFDAGAGPFGAPPVAGESIKLPGFGVAGFGGRGVSFAGTGTAGSAGVKAMPPAHDMDAGADDAGQ